MNAKSRASPGLRTTTSYNHQCELVVCSTPVRDYCRHGFKGPLSKFKAFYYHSDRMLLIY